MTLRQITRDIIKLVEEKSGIPVRVTQDPKLPTLATVHIARQGANPAHLIIYKPSAGESPDYTICFQCTYILRLFSNPPEKRFDLTDTTKGREEVESMLTEPGGIASKYRLRPPQIAELRAQFLNGLLIHLRSIPVGLRVSHWLTTNYPELEPLEKEHVQKEFDINRQSLSNEVKEITPPKIFKATQAITAAYTLYWSEKYGRPDVFNIYRLEGFERGASKLLRIFEQTPDGPNYDQDLIDAWGKHLELTEWYSWRPYQPPSE